MSRVATFENKIAGQGGVGVFAECEKIREMWDNHAKCVTGGNPSCVSNVEFFKLFSFLVGKTPAKRNKFDLKVSFCSWLNLDWWIDQLIDRSILTDWHIFVIIIYFENVDFFLLWLDVCSNIKSLHISLNTAHSGCKPSSFMSISSLLVFAPTFHPATYTFLLADTQISPLSCSQTIQISPSHSSASLWIPNKL